MPTPLRAPRRALAAFGVVAVAAALPVLAPSLGQAHGVARAAATGATGATPASDDPNNYTCAGHIQKGVAESGVPGTQVKYQFSCDGPISGYQLETEPHQIQYFDQAPVVALQGVVQSLDNFSCNAFVPGLQVNCTGQASQPFEVITGQFTIAGKNSLCTEPRVDPILTVTYATATATLGGTKAAPTATATVTQYISGPFDLGRPWGCKGDRYGASTRLGSHPPKVVLSAAKP